MPKRIPSPPPPEDEPRYLTVVHPYPLNANLELHADRRTLALWLACCTGKDVLLAMFHKPASPGMVVVEVDRDFDRFNELLGSHAWSGFLLRPTKEQIDKFSKVFYCTYNTGRLVEKNGWKRVNIEEHWFQGWKANNSIIRHPYPKTSYCDVPSEAKTGAPMCRPLPQRSFPVPPPLPAPPVGSAEWLAVRSANPSASSAPSSTRRGKKAAPSDTASVTSASSRSTQSFSPPPAPSSATSSVMANYRAKNDVAWKRGPPSISSVASAVTSRAPSTAGSSSAARSARSSRAVAAPPAPPGLGPRLTSPSQSRPPERFDWSEDVERFEEEKISGPIEPSQVYDYNEEDQPRYSKAAAMSDLFGDDDSAPVATSVRNGGGGTRPRGLDDPDYDPWNQPEDAAAPVNDQPQAGGAAAPWKGYAEPRLEPPTKAKKKGEWTCSQHGSLCSPGICKERARFERDKRMQEDRERWAEEKRRRDEYRAKAKLKKERKEAEARGEGEGETSSSGSDDDTSHDQGPSAPPRPDPEDWSIPWENTGDADTQSVVSSARHAWGGVSGSDDDDDDEGASVASSRTTNTSSAASRSSRAPPPARNKGPAPSAKPWENPSPAQVPSISSRPATRQSAWDARSAASQNLSVGGRSEWPSASGYSRTSSVSAASAIGSDSDQRSGTGPATRRSASDARSIASSSARTDAGPPTPSTSSGANGFPTFADTEWGDPIAVALAKADAEGGKKSKGARKRRNKARIAQVQAQAQVQATQASLLEAGLDGELPPGGPGSSWGDPNVAW